MDSIHNKLIEQVIDRTWIIKTKYPKYKPQKNLKLPVTIIMNFIIYSKSNVEINGMIYYSYLLYIGCINYE